MGLCGQYSSCRTVPGPYFRQLRLAHVLLKIESRQDMSQQEVSNLVWLRLSHRKPR